MSGVEMKKLMILLMVVALAGCESDKIYRGSGIDEIPYSKCAKCNEIPVYVDGKWLQEKK